MAAEDNSVLIIGAGPGGLALGQLLRARNIPYRVFERDVHASARQQGWAVALVECLPDLEENLPKDLGDIHAVSVNHGSTEYDTMGIVDADSGDVIGVAGAVPKGEPGYMLRANRHHFRQFLLKNLDISFGKDFDHYEEDESGVTVAFKDGSTVRGAVLVGAEGAHSRVRRQLLGGESSALIPSEYVAIIQETTLSRSEYLPLHKYGSSGTIAAKTNLRFLVGLLEILDGGNSAHYYTATCWKSANPEKESMWVKKASKQELFDKVLRIIEGMPTTLTNILAQGGVESISDNQITFSEFVSPASLPNGRVTLLGDAGHTMVPFRGLGANTAVNDACLFARLAGEAAGKNARSLDVPWLLQEYQSKMLVTGKNAVLTSRAAGDDALGALKGRVNNMEKMK